MSKYGIKVRFDEDTWLWVLASTNTPVCVEDPEKLLFDTAEQAHEYAKKVWRIKGDDTNVIIREVSGD